MEPNVNIWKMHTGMHAIDTFPFSVWRRIWRRNLRPVFRFSRFSYSPSDFRDWEFSALPPDSDGEIRNSDGNLSARFSARLKKGRRLSYIHSITIIDQLPSIETNWWMCFCYIVSENAARVREDKVPRRLLLRVGFGPIKMLVDRTKIFTIFEAFRFQTRCIGDTSTNGMCNPYYFRCTGALSNMRKFENKKIHVSSRSGSPAKGG